MLDFTIRPATVADAPGIARVHVLTWQCAYKGQIPLRPLAPIYYDKISITS